MRNAKMPLTGKEHFCITKAQQTFLSIHGGESCMRSFFACCVFMYLYGLRCPAGGGKSDPPPALSALLSYRCVHVGVWRSFRLPGGFSSLHKILSWKFWTLHGFE